MADAAGFRRGLSALGQPNTPDANARNACRQRNQALFDATLAQARALANGGDPAAATKRLASIDMRFGGLAAPRSIELLHKLDAQRAAQH